MAFYGAAIVLALVHVFVTFRGLKSATGMEQAVVARELARGHGWQTLVGYPQGAALLEAQGRAFKMSALPAIHQAPLQPLVLAPLFQVLHRHQLFDPSKGGSVYLLDRAVACVGVICLLLAMLWTHGAARRLFDESVAAAAVLCLLVCEPLWQLAVSGSPAALLLLLCALAFRLLVELQLRLSEGRRGNALALALGVTAGLMVLTEWMAVWLVAGLLLGCLLFLRGQRSALLLVILPPVLALSGWCFGLMRLCGDPLGGAKVIFQAHLLPVPPALLLRSYSLAIPPVVVDDLIRKLFLNWRDQLASGAAYLGFLAPAALFFPAWLHPFRRVEARRCCQIVGLTLAVLAVGMGLLGLPERVEDDRALYLVLAPAMCIFGSALLVVMWARLHGVVQTGGFWTRQGGLVLAAVVSAVPMLASLPAEMKTGLVLRSRIPPHWPPYVPDRVTFVRRLLEPGEVVFSDAPWFVAWYADVPCMWLPVKRAEFSALVGKMEAAGSPVAGIVITPLSARVNHLHEVFDGPYREWPDLVFRGPMLALDREFVPHPDFKYKVPLPLVAVPVGSRENLSMMMTFYTDRLRTLK
jgi:hypothetical protein